MPHHRSNEVGRLIAEINRVLTTAEVPNVKGFDGPAVELLETLVDLRQFALDLGRGDLSTSLTRRGQLAGGLKALQASLRHLTWQTTRVASGDFAQRVQFLGEFSIAFNAMVQQLQRTQQQLIEKNSCLEAEITERRRAESTLAASEALHRSIFAVSPDGIVVTNLEGSVVRISPAALRMLGYVDEADTLGRNIVDVLVGPDQVETAIEPVKDRVRSMLEAVARGEDSAPCEHPATRQDGSHFYQEATADLLRDAQGCATGIVCIVRDVTRHHDERRRLEHESQHDALTGLSNRRYFMRCAEELEASDKRPVAVISIDADGLKEVNDRDGHAAGDRLLRRIATALKSSFREQDVVARLGGDEFGVLIANAAPNVVDRLLTRLRALSDDQPGGDGIRFSLGMATAGPGASVLEALEQADQKMYAAKRARKAELVLVGAALESAPRGYRHRAAAGSSH